MVHKTWMDGWMDGWESITGYIPYKCSNLAFFPLYHFLALLVYICWFIHGGRYKWWLSVSYKNRIRVTVCMSDSPKRWLTMGYHRLWLMFHNRASHISIWNCSYWENRLDAITGLNVYSIQHTASCKAKLRQNSYATKICNGGILVSRNQQTAQNA